MKFEKKKLLQENKELKERYEILMVKVKKLKKENLRQEKIKK